MKNAKLAPLTLALVLTACGSGSYTTSPTTSGSSGPPSPVSIKATDGALFWGSGSMSGITNSLFQVGDQTGVNLRSALTFPLAALAGSPTPVSASLRICLDTTATPDPVGNLGSLRVYKIPARSTILLADYAATETFATVLFSLSSQFNASPTQTCFALSVLPALQESLANADAYLTLKLRFDVNLGSGLHSVNFFGNLSSVPLDHVIPRLQVAF